MTTILLILGCVATFLSLALGVAMLLCWRMEKMSSEVDDEARVQSQLYGPKS